MIRKLIYSILLSAAAASPTWAARLGNLPIVGAMTNMSGNMQAVAYSVCIIGGTLCLASALRHHHDFGAIGTTAVGVLGISALALGMTPMLALIPGVAAALI